MSRTSRIPHPPGSRYVAIYHWAVTQWGLAEAAVLGLLDFFDRGQQTEGKPLASRKRIVADLEGIVGRDGVDKALRTLVDAGALKMHRTTTPGERNLQTRVDYCLDIDGITHILDAAGTPDFRSSGNYENQEPRQLLNPVLESGVPSNIDIDIDAAAAPRAQARGHADAAASRINQKRRNKRPSGIVTWTQEDIQAAESIEQQQSADQIGAAAATLLIAGKEPVPGLVARELERQQREQKAAMRREATEAAYQSHLAAPPPTPIDMTAKQLGEKLLANLRRQRSDTTNH